jgi:chemotaxis methyl-accepting protein methylase
VSAVNDAASTALARRIAEAAGLAGDVYKDKCLRRRIGVRMRACGVHTLADYLTVLHREAGEAERLRDTLTINVTRFYRNPETWDALRRLALPALWAARQGRLNVWSAGCSSGEEPYTVAMLVAEQAREQGHPEWNDRLQVDATDIDRVSLERAAAARYRADAAVDMPPALRDRYLTADGADMVVVPTIRRRVSVTHLDLGADAPLRERYDLILCRNVVIYFDRPMQERLFLTFVSRLAPGGVLVLGKVETLLGPARAQLQLVDARERIYRRDP